MSLPRRAMAAARTSSDAESVVDPRGVQNEFNRRLKDARGRPEAERLIAEVDVAGSTPVSRSNLLTADYRKRR